MSIHGNYKPGTVAVATVRGVPNVRVMRHEASAAWKQGWWAVDAWDDIDDPADVANIRPLVVIDHSHIGDALNGLVRVLKGSLPMLGDDEFHALNELADQIEAQTKPPRIPEPGHWGVVSAREENSTSAIDWLRTPSGNWASVLGSRIAAWSALVDPSLVRPGIEDES